MKNGGLAFMIYPDLRVIPFDMNYDSDFQHRCLKAGNCFKTRKEAEEMKKKILKLLKGR